MAGLFSYWRPEGSQGRPIPTFTVITVAANRWMARIHDRMPAILQDDEVKTWLDPRLTDSRQLHALLKAPPENFLDCYPVDPKLVNSARMDAPECVNETGTDYSRWLKTVDN